MMIHAHPTRNPAVHVRKRVCRGCGARAVRVVTQLKFGVVTGDHLVDVTTLLLGDVVGSCGAAACEAAAVRYADHFPPQLCDRPGAAVAVVFSDGNVVVRRFPPVSASEGTPHEH
jgi:hypothetical protein